MATRRVLPEQEIPSVIPMMPMVRPNMTTPTSTDSLGLYPRPTPFFDSFPSSVDGVRRVAVDNDEGLSKTMWYVTVNIILAAWDEGLENEIFNGQLVFAVNYFHGMAAAAARSEIAKYQMAVMNIRHVNRFLAEGYSIAHRAFQSVNGRRPIEDDLTPDQLRLMADSPVRNWSSFSFMVEALRASHPDSLVKQILYLNEEMILDTFNVLGWVHGQVPGDNRVKQVAVRVLGSMDDVENIWSPELGPNDRLYFILRRIFDYGLGEWTHFAFVPWFGRTIPTIEERTYMDYTGNLQVGCAIFLGSVDRITHDHRMRVDELPQLIGLKPTTLQRVKIGPEPGCVRITATGSKSRAPWLN
ncbi:MAG: hypothetical protein ACOVP3_00655 [Rhodoluna sp.]